MLCKSNFAPNPENICNFLVELLQRYAEIFAVLYRECFGEKFGFHVDLNRIGETAPVTNKRPKSFVFQAFTPAMVSWQQLTKMAYPARKWDLFHPTLILVKVWSLDCFEERVRSLRLSVPVNGNV